MFLFPFRERRNSDPEVDAHFPPPPARKRHLTLGSLNAPALNPPSHSLSSLFFSFKAPIDFEIKMAVLPSMTPTLHLLSPVPFSHPAFPTPWTSVTSHPFALKDFSNKDVKKSFSRVFYHKFLLVSCLRMLLRRTW